MTESDFEDLLSQVAPFLPPDKEFLPIYDQCVSLSPDDVVKYISDHKYFSIYHDAIEASIRGMTPQEVAVVLTNKFIDIYFPDLVKRINSSETEFELYKSVIFMLVERINGGKDVCKSN
jgi:hypothetical protein